MRARADVPAQVDAPQAGAVELDAVDDGVAGVAGLGVVLGVGGLPLEDEVEPAVPVEVADGGVVGLVGVGDSVGSGAARGRGDGHVLVSGAELDGVDGVGLLDAVHDRADRVVGLGGRARVEVVRGAGDRRRVDQHTGPVDVERHVVRVGAEPAPADQVAAVGMDTDDAPVEGLHLTGRGRMGRSGAEGGEPGGDQGGRGHQGRADGASAVPPVRVLHDGCLLGGQTASVPSVAAARKEVVASRQAFASALYAYRRASAATVRAIRSRSSAGSSTSIAAPRRRNSS